jgi:DNA modification methylase
MNAVSYFGTLRKTLCADLDFHGTDGKYASHGWHPFPAKFPPQLPRFFIEHLSDVEDVVFDPMLGSGTTLVEAMRLGRRVIGCDIDPLARMIAVAKLTPMKAAKTLQAGYRIIDAAKRDYRQNRDDLERELNLRFDEKTNEFINYWFPPQQQLELIALLKNIESLPEYSEDSDISQSQERIRDFLKIVFSSTIIAKSGGVSLARDLAHTRPHRDTEKNPNSAFVEFAKRLERNLIAYDRSRLKSQTMDTPFQIRAASAEKTGLANASVDLIVTSPPYANNAIDYMRAHKFSLVWFGWKIDDLTKIRARYLGHDTASDEEYDHLPEQCEKTLVRLAELDSKKAVALRRYFGEMSAVIAEMQRVLKKGKAAVIVVGTSHLRGMDVETQRGLAAIGEKVGFDLAGIGVRRLDRDKRMMPARWGNKRHSQIEERMHEEYVIGLVKP